DRASKRLLFFTSTYIKTGFHSSSPTTVSKDSFLGSTFQHSSSPFPFRCHTNVLLSLNSDEG
ncbi:hypothetical protein CDAR_608281, partial [Caerostris darwini]